MKKAQSLPHFGIKRGFTRKGNIVCLEPASTEKDANGKETYVPPDNKQFPSISTAKRFMRTGEANK